MIVAQKDGFEQKLADLIEVSGNRVTTEQEGFDTLIEFYRGQLDDTISSETGALTQAIDDAIQLFELTLNQSTDTLDGALDQAHEEIETFLDQRLDWWNKQREHEIVHAKYTNPDSYYIYNLLRLIQAKDDAVQ